MPCMAPLLPAMDSISMPAKEKEGREEERKEEEREEEEREEEREGA